MSPFAAQSTLSRRDLTRLAGAAGLSLGLLPAAARRAFAQGGPDPADFIKGMSPEMIVHNEKLLVTETPLPLLRKYKHTPSGIMFSRYHFPHVGQPDFATTAASPVTEWTLRVDGLVQRPRSLSLDDLAKRKQESRVAVLQCAGNGRAFFAAKQKVPGGQWHNGGMANVVWEGPALRPLLADMNLMASPQATWLTAQPWDKDQPATPVGPGFAKSFRLADPALDNAILALTMNGKPIPALHGGPVRLIVPGYYGNMNVKMVAFLLFAAEESPSIYQSVAYRVPLQPVEPGQFSFDQYNTHNSVPTYGHKIKSVIFTPLPSDKPKSGKTTITGVAFNDGMAKITSVEVSTDGGASWHAATIEAPESPWAWHHFSLETELPSGTHVLASRATDALGRTQPMDGLVGWNPRGYEWNGVERTSVAFD